MIPFHLYEKAKRERDDLKRLLKWVATRINEVPIITIGGNIVWDINSASYNELANDVLTRIDDCLEES